MNLSTLFPAVRRLTARGRKRIELRRAPKIAPNVSLWSILTCPECGCSKLEAIPRHTVKLSYTCGECDAVLEPASWECCVYCSYGSVRCVKVQSRI